MRAVVDVGSLRTRPVGMDDSINPFEHTDVDCSGRSLATLLVAWVSAAMVASVLLRWKYMWIALTVLTLLFLIACGYAACNARRAQERVILSEEARILERRRWERSIQSVSGSVDIYPEITDPPAYQAYWITDLPPPYAVVIGAEPPGPMPRSSRNSETDLTSSTDGGPRLSNPPPYSVAIQSEPHALQTIRRQTNRTAETSSSDQLQSIIDEPTNSQRERVHESGLPWDEDKNANEQSNNSGPPNLQTVRPSGTHQYLSNIISCTFGIGQRRNAERNSSTPGHTIINRERPDVVQPSTTIAASTRVSVTSPARTCSDTVS